MSTAHRREDMREVLEEARHLDAVFLEVVGSAKIAHGQIQVFGGASLDDFDGEDEEKQARLIETQLAMEAVGVLLAQMPTKLSDGKTTVEQALLRIAKKKPQRRVSF